MNKYNILLIVTLVIFGIILPLYAMPNVYVPFDDSVEIICKGKKGNSGLVYGHSNYQQGMSGKALLVKRYAYDQVTAVNFPKLPEMNLSQGTISFYFKPEWTLNDNKMHYMLCFQAGEFKIYAVKTKSNKMDVSVCAPKQIQLLAKPRIKNGTWHHFVITWNLREGKAALYMDGLLLAEKSVSPDLIKLPETWKPASMWLGKPGSDRFKAMSGDGLYDELKIFDRYMPSTEIKKLALSSQRNVLMNKVELPRRQFASLQTEFKIKKSQAGQTVPLFKIKTNLGTGILYYSATSKRTSFWFEMDKSSVVCTSPYPLDIQKKYTFNIQQEGAILYFCLDGAKQDSITLSRPDTIKLEAFFCSPDLEQKTVLSDKLPESYKSDMTVFPESVLEKKLWSFDGAAERSNEGRFAVSLNGMWRTYPTNNYSSCPPETAFGYMRVPGSYRSPLFDIFKEKAGKLVSQKWKWHDKPLLKYLSAWYQRMFSIPEDMKGKRIYLNFENINGDYARIYVNDTLIDNFISRSNYYSAVPNPRGIDITSLCKKENVITVFIERKYAKLWRGYPSIADHANMALGNVWLEASASPVRFRGLLAFPSVKKENVLFKASFQNPEKYSGKATIEIRFNKDGKLKKKYVHDIVLTGKTLERLEFSKSWEDPELWDYEHPELYNMDADIMLVKCF